MLTQVLAVNVDVNAGSYFLLQCWLNVDVGLNVDVIVPSLNAG